MVDGKIKKVETPITGGFRERIGMVGWLGLYLSGSVLFFLLLIHILAIHFLGESAIGAESVREDVSSLFLTITGFGLLFLAIIHGLIGFYRMLLDLEIFGKRASRIFKWILYGAGGGLALFGIIIFSGLSSL